MRIETADQERNKMKITMVSLTAAMLLSMGSMTPVYAQHEGQSDKESDRQDEKRGEGGKMQGARQQERGRAERAPEAEQRQPQERQPQQAQRQPREAQRQNSFPQRNAELAPARQQQRFQQPAQPERTQQQARTWQQQKGWAQNGASQGHATFQQNRAQHWAADHRNWVQRGGYGGYYVPQDRFLISFGSQHLFRLNTRPVIYQGYPRFEYGGFSFLMVDPWPEYWPDSWYSADDVYIDYDAGYYLYDRRDPQVRLAITITL
jgi:hypothetical protein